MVNLDVITPLSRVLHVKPWQIRETKEEVKKEIVVTTVKIATVDVVNGNIIKI